MAWPGESVTHWGDAKRAVIHTHPGLALCAPSFLGQDHLLKLEAAALKAFPKPVKADKKVKKTDEDENKMPKKKSKGMEALRGGTRGGPTKKNGAKSSTKHQKEAPKFEFAGFDLAMFVMHPFRRLAKSYVRLQHSTEFDTDQLKAFRTSTLVGKDFTFENFVNFVIQPKSHAYSKPDEITSVRKLWQSYNFDCLVCSQAFYPDLIFKLDSEEFGDEWESFVEDYALDSIDGDTLEDFTAKMTGLAKLPKSELDALLAKLPQETLNQLADYYRIDMEMFGYSPVL